MPSNQMDINVEFTAAQADVQAIDKLTKALQDAGATGGGGATIKRQFGTAEQGISYLREQEAGQKAIGGKLGGASVKPMEGGGFEASAKVENEVQKKAFSPGGMIAGMGTAVGAIGAGFKTLLGMSKIFQTFMGTTGKILATAVDLMLAPLMPFFMRIMVWLIQKIFPLATKIGNFVGGFSDVGIGAALTGGYVALKFGPTLLSKAGESLGKALLNKMPFDTFGENITYGLLNAKEALKKWGSKAGGFIQDGLKAAVDLAKSTFETIGTWVQKGFKAAIDAASELFKGIGTLAQKGFKAAVDAASSLWEGIGTLAQKGFKAAIDAASELWKGIGTLAQKGFKAAVDLASSLWEGIGTLAQKGFKAAVDLASSLWEGIGTLAQKGFKAAVDLASSLWEGIGTLAQKGFKAAVDLASSLWEGIGTLAQKGFKAAVDLASSLWEGIGTLAQKGFKAAVDLASSLWEGIGTLAQKGFKAAVDLASSLWEGIGTLAQKGFKAAVDLASGLWEGIGTLAQKGFKAAVDLASGVWEGIGTLAQKGFKAAVDLASSLWEGIGTLAQKGFKAAVDLASSLWEGIGTLAQKGFKVAVDAASELWKGIGTLAQAGFKAAVDGASALWKGIGTLAQAGFKVAVDSAKDLWTGLGKIIGGGISLAKDALSGAGKAIGDAIGGAMKVAKNLWSGIGSVGGMIGIGIGAVAIGATIGYMMWKKYDEYQKGKDITEGLTDVEQVRMLQAMGGYSESTALTIQKGMGESIYQDPALGGADMIGAVSTSTQGMQDFMEKTKDIADQVRLFGTFQHEVMDDLSRKEQLLFAKLMEEGVFGDAGQFSGVIKIIRDARLKGGEQLRSAEHELANMFGKVTHFDRVASATQEKYADQYSVGVGPVQFGVQDLGILNPIAAPGLIMKKVMEATGTGPDFVTGLDLSKDEQAVRKALVSMGIDPGYQLSPELANIGALVSSLQGYVPTTYLKTDVAADIAGADYSEQDIKGLSYGALTINVNTESIEVLTTVQKANIQAMLDTYFTKMSGAVGSSIGQ